MKNLTNYAIIATCTFMVCLINSNTFGQQNNSISTEEFVQEAATSGMNEIAMGNLGQKRSENSKIIAYADMIVKDHTAANTELKALATKKNIKLPDSTNTPINSMQTRTDTTLQTPPGTPADTSINKADTSMNNVDTSMSKAANKSSMLNTNGADFDSQYIQMMIGDHQKAIALFEKAAGANDADVKSFANKYLPILRKHLDDAVNLSKEKENKAENTGLQ